jgi:DNA (cytosine-5)-methyltransferase 1
MIAVPGVEVDRREPLAPSRSTSTTPTTPTPTTRIVDLHLEDPRYFPRTDVLWASPECTKWSQANGTRAVPTSTTRLFDDPLTEAETPASHPLPAADVRRPPLHRAPPLPRVVVENVVDIATQAKYRTRRGTRGSAASASSATPTGSCR